MTETEFEKIVDKYSRLLWSVGAKVLDGVGNEQDVEECVADVFIDLWRSPESFDPDRGSLKTWLCVKCKSKAIDRFRSICSHMTEDLDETDLSDLWEPPDDLLAKERGSALREAIARLDDQEREIIISRFFLDRKPRQIARLTGLPVRKIENIIYRTKKKLVVELEAYR
ncbi:MAG: sigma-70 family RNA polymerase sigma factor [Clostridia bacterium]|nr:sigma-70 family RNA polymerase sigma factor [Clostridia bacterium]